MGGADREAVATKKICDGITDARVVIDDEDCAADDASMFHHGGLPTLCSIRVSPIATVEALKRYRTLLEGA